MGATSQDILDTACILQCRCVEHVEGQLQQCYTTITASQAISPSSHDWAYMVTASFTITLGHKLARWASAFKRDLDRIQAIKSRVLLS